MREYALRNGSVDVWAVALDVEVGADAAERLSRPELERSRRFLDQRLARRFRVAHLALRAILARYLRCRPAEVCLVVDAHGKPSLQGPVLDFNLTRSGGLALVGVTTAGSMGIDVEVLRSIPEALVIAESQFAESEALQLRRAPPVRRSREFLEIWTLKEAALKATGVGLRGSLGVAAVPATEASAGGSVFLCPDSGAAVGATGLGIGRGCIAAVAGEGFIPTAAYKELEPGWGLT